MSDLRATAKNTGSIMKHIGMMMMAANRPFPEFGGPSDADDISQYFKTQIVDSGCLTNFLRWSTDPDAGGANGYSLYRLQHPLDGMLDMYLATSDDYWFGQVKTMVDNVIAAAVVDPTFGNPYLGYGTYLSEAMWAGAATRLALYMTSDPAQPGGPNEDPVAAKAMYDFLKDNELDKWGLNDGSRAEGATYETRTLNALNWNITPSPTPVDPDPAVAFLHVWSDRIFVGIKLCYLMDALHNALIAAGQIAGGTPLPCDGTYFTWLDRFIQSTEQPVNNTTNNGNDMIMLWDVGNPNNEAPMVYGQYEGADTAHMGRVADLFATVREVDPGTIYITESRLNALSDTLTKRIWNQISGPGIGFTNYIDGNNSGYRTGNMLLPYGNGLVYLGGWSRLSRWNNDVRGVMLTLLEFLQTDPNPNEYIVARNAVCDGFVHVGGTAAVSTM